LTRAVKAMGYNEKSGMAVLPTLDKSQLQHDQQIEERRRIAERLTQALREAGYACTLAEKIRPSVFKSDH
jgi:hypothetical protein